MGLPPLFSSSRLQSMEKVLAHCGEHNEDFEIDSELRGVNLPYIGYVIPIDRAQDPSINNPFYYLIKDMIVPTIHRVMRPDDFNAVMLKMMATQSSVVVDLFLRYGVTVEEKKETVLSIIAKSNLEKGPRFIDPKKLFSFGEERSWIEELHQSKRSHRISYVLAKNICLCADHLMAFSLISGTEKAQLYHYAKSLMSAIDFFEDVSFDEDFIYQVEPKNEREKEILAFLLETSSIEPRNLLKISFSPYLYFPRRLIFEGLRDWLSASELDDEEFLGIISSLVSSPKNCELIEDLSFLIPDQERFLALMKKVIFITEKRPDLKTECISEESPIFKMVQEHQFEELYQLFDALIDLAIKRCHFDLLEAIFNELIAFQTFHPLLTAETPDRPHPNMLLMDIITSQTGCKLFLTFKKLSTPTVVISSETALAHPLTLAILQTYQAGFSHPLAKNHHHLYSPDFLASYKKGRLTPSSYAIMSPFMVALIAKGQTPKALARALFFPSTALSPHPDTSPDKLKVFLRNLSLEFLKDSWLSFKKFPHLKPNELFLCYSERIRQFILHLPAKMHANLLEHCSLCFSDYLEEQAKRRKSGLVVLAPSDEISQAVYFLNLILSPEQKMELKETLLQHLHPVLTGRSDETLTLDQKSRVEYLLEDALQDGFTLLLPYDPRRLRLNETKLFDALQQKIRSINITKDLNWTYFHGMMFLRDQIIHQSSFREILTLQTEHWGLVTQSHFSGELLWKEMLSLLSSHPAILARFNHFLNSYLATNDPEFLEELKAFKQLFPSQFLRLLDSRFLTELSSSRMDLMPKALAVPDSAICHVEGDLEEKLMLSNEIYHAFQPSLLPLFTLVYVNDRFLMPDQWGIVQNLLEQTLRFSTYPIFGKSFAHVKGILPPGFGAEPIEESAKKLHDQYITLNPEEAKAYCKALHKKFRDALCLMDVGELKDFISIVDTLTIAKTPEEKAACAFSVQEDLLAKKTGGHYTKEELQYLANALVQQLLLKQNHLQLEADWSIAGTFLYRYEVAFTRFVKLAKELIRTKKKEPQLAQAITLLLIAFDEKSIAALPGLEATIKSLLEDSHSFKPQFLADLFFIKRVLNFDKIAKSYLSEIPQVSPLAIDYVRQRFSAELGILKPLADATEFAGRFVVDRYLGTKDLRAHFKEQFIAKMVETVTNPISPFFQKPKTLSTEWHLAILNAEGYIPCIDEKFVKVDAQSAVLQNILNGTRYDTITPFLTQHQRYLGIFRSFFEELSSSTLITELKTSAIFSGEEANHVIGCIASCSTAIASPFRTYITAFSKEDKIGFFTSIGMEMATAIKLHDLLEESLALELRLKTCLSHPTTSAFRLFKEKMHLEQLRKLLDFKLAKMSAAGLMDGKIRQDHLDFYGLLMSFMANDAISSHIVSLFDSPHKLLEVAQEYHRFTAIKLKLEKNIHDLLLAFNIMPSVSMLKELTSLITDRPFKAEGAELTAWDAKTLGLIKQIIRNLNLIKYHEKPLQAKLASRPSIMQAHAIMALEYFGFVTIHQRASLVIIDQLLRI